MFCLSQLQRTEETDVGVAYCKCKAGTGSSRLLVADRIAFVVLVMVALWNRADHYIFALWLLLSFFFIPRLISAAADWMSAILPHIVWP